MSSPMAPHAEPPAARRRLARSPSGLPRLLCLAPLRAIGAPCARGREAEHRQDYDRAVVEYTKALAPQPDDAERAPRARAGQAARVRGSLPARPPARRAPASSTRRSSSTSSPSELNPTSGDIDDELRTTRNKLRAKVAVVARGQDRAADAHRAHARSAAAGPRPAARREAAGLAHLPRREQPRRLHGASRASPTSASSSTRRSATRRSRSTSATPRSTTRSTPWPAPRARSSASRRRARSSIIPDTPAKRREYEEEIVRTFYLSNADLKETMDLLRWSSTRGASRRSTATNAITIKDTPERIAAAARVISAIDKARPEVIIDVELLEVDRTQAAGVRPADRVARLARASTASASAPARRPTDAHAAGAAQPDAVRRPAGEPAGALLPAAQDRHEHAHAGQSAAAHVGRHAGAGAVRRARAGARRRRSRRSRPAARRSSRSRRSTTRTSA